MENIEAQYRQIFEFLALNSANLATLAVNWVNSLPLMLICGNTISLPNEPFLETGIFAFLLSLFEIFYIICQKVFYNNGLLRHIVIFEKNELFS